MKKCLPAVDRPVRLLKDCGPAALSIEVTNLTSEGGGSSGLLLAFIHMIDSMLASGRDFDLAHSYLALFLKVSQFLFLFFLHQLSFIVKLSAQFPVDLCCCFFQLHLRPVSQDSVAMAALLQLSSRLEAGWAELQASFDQSLCLLSYAKSALL